MVEHIEILEHAVAVAHRAVWAMLTTIDPIGRPRNQVVHPGWELSGGGVVGWVTTRRTPVKTRHDLARGAGVADLRGAAARALPRPGRDR